MAVAIVTTILLGMRVLAVQLSDPFGSDAVDFEIEAFLKGAYVNSIAHLQQPKLAEYCERTLICRKDHFCHDDVLEKGSSPLPVSD